MSFWKKLAVMMLMLPTMAMAWPNKAITIVVPWPAGGIGDQIARPLAAGLEARLGTSVVVKNVAGGNHAVALSSVVNEHDDHTFVMIDTGYASSTVSTRPDLAQQFTPTFIVAKAPIMLSGSNQMSMASLHQSMQSGTPVTVGNTGADLPQYLWIKGLTKRPNLNPVFYKGGTPTMIDLAGGHIDYAVMSMSLTMQYADAGKVKPLAIASRQRHPNAPEVPTYLEIGLQGEPGEIWWGLITHNQTSDIARQTFSQVASDIVNTHPAIQKLTVKGLILSPMSGTEAVAFYNGEVEKFARIKKTDGHR